MKNSIGKSGTLIISLLLSANTLCAQNPSGSQTPMPGMEMREQPIQPARPKKAPSGPVYKLSELEEMALAHNPTLSQAASEVRLAKGKTQQAGLYPNPTVGYSGEEIRGGAFGGGQQGFFIEQRFVTGGKLGMNRRVAGQEVRLAEIEGDEQKYRVLNAVRIAYTQVLAAQEMLGVEEDLSRVTAETAKTARQLWNIGQRVESEVLQAEVENQKAIMAYQMQQNTLDQRWTQLRAVVGNPTLPRGTVEGALDQDLPNKDADQLVREILENSPAVKIARTNVTRSEAVLARAQREPIPDVLVRAGLQQNRELLDSSVPNGPRAGLQGFAEVGVQIPIFNRNQGNVESARANAERTKGEVRRVELLLQERAATLVQNYRNAQIMVNQYRKEILPRAQRSYELLVSKYGQMAASYPQVLSSEQTFLQLKSEYVSSLDRFRVNAIALEGFLLTDGLEAPARPGEIDLPVREINLPTANGAMGKDNQ